jgi:hypothetical protein
VLVCLYHLYARADLRCAYFVLSVCAQEGNTALMVASKYGQAAVAELLLLAGADYFLRNQVRTVGAWCGFYGAFVSVTFLHACCMHLQWRRPILVHTMLLRSDRSIQLYQCLYLTSATHTYALIAAGPAGSGPGGAAGAAGHVQGLRPVPGRGAPVHAPP